MRRQLSQALASIAEIYMTDLCDEADAEEQCEKAASMAVEADKGCAEALVAMASLRLVRQRLEDARPLLREAARLVVGAHARLVAREKEKESAEPGAAGGGGGEGKPSTAASGGGGSGGGSAAMDGSEGAAGDEGSEDALGPLAVPDVGARMDLGRSCLEAGEYEGAVGVLHTVLAEDEHVWEAWYRLAQACVGTADPSAALDTIEEAGKLIDKERQRCVAVQQASKKGPLAVLAASRAASAAGLGRLPTLEEAA